MIGRYGNVPSLGYKNDEDKSTDKSTYSDVNWMETSESRHVGNGAGYFE
jgi:hypothetical protein